ncbi:MAG: DUF624 domain-containing protein [Eubacteriales bacterium]|nr:DUF624 domain-containing protein [Eubacteriales bacterium]
MKFNPEGPFFEFMNTLAAFIGLNVLFLITCLPVVTIGPALTALYTVTLQEARKEHGYIFSTYLKAFKRNFPQSAAAFLLQMVLMLVFLFNAFFWGNQGTVTGNIILFVITVLLVILALSFLYTFPLLARFENTLKQTLQNSISIAIVNPRITLGLLAVQVVCVLLCAIVPQAKIFMLLLGFSFLAYCNSLLFNKLFSSYESGENSKEKAY